MLVRIGIRRVVQGIRRIKAEPVQPGIENCPVGLHLDRVPRLAPARAIDNPGNRHAILPGGDR